MGPIRRCPPTEPDHPHTLFTIARLADNLGEQQCSTEADELARTAVEHATTALGAEHEATLSRRLTLAWVPYRTVPHESEDFIRATVRDIVAVPGDGHPDRWAARHLLVESLHGLGRTDEAEPKAHTLTALREEHQGADHPHTLRARADLGAWSVTLQSFLARGLERLPLPVVWFRCGGGHGR